MNTVVFCAIIALVIIIATYYIYLEINKQIINITNRITKEFEHAFDKQYNEIYKLKKEIGELDVKINYIESKIDKIKDDNHNDFTDISTKLNAIVKVQENNYNIIINTLNDHQIRLLDLTNNTIKKVNTSRTNTKKTNIKKNNNEPNSL